MSSMYPLLHRNALDMLSQSNSTREVTLQSLSWLAHLAFLRAWTVRVTETNKSASFHVFENKDGPSVFVFKETPFSGHLHHSRCHPPLQKLNFTVCSIFVICVGVLLHHCVTLGSSIGGGSGACTRCLKVLKKHKGSWHEFSPKKSVIFVGCKLSQAFFSEGARDCVECSCQMVKMQGHHNAQETHLQAAELPWKSPGK